MKTTMRLFLLVAGLGLADAAHDEGYHCCPDDTCGASIVFGGCNFAPDPFDPATCPIGAVPCPIINCCYVQNGCSTCDDCTVCADDLYAEGECTSVDMLVCDTYGMVMDPHVKLWNSKWIDYHGECDLILLDAPDFHDGMGLQVHVRTTIRYDYSYISTAAIKIGDSGILHVNSFGEYSWNDVESTDLSAEVVISGVNLTMNTLNEKEAQFDIKAGRDHVQITTFKDFVSVTFVETTMRSFGTSRGIMGAFGSGKMLARDGTTVLDDPVKFGDEWQVRDSEEMMFLTARAPQYPEKCTMPMVSAHASDKRRRLGASISRTEAEEACARFGRNKMLCADDVMKTGDLEIAKFGKY